MLKTNLVPRLRKRALTKKRPKGVFRSKRHRAGLVICHVSVSVIDVAISVHISILRGFDSCSRCPVSRSFKIATDTRSVYNVIYCWWICCVQKAPSHPKLLYLYLIKNVHKVINAEFENFFKNLDCEKVYEYLVDVQSCIRVKI